MMALVIDGIVNLLAASPDAVLPAGRIGDRMPFNSGELPAISVSLALDPPRGNGVGRFLREGRELVRNTAVLDVQATPDTFSADLKTLRIQPLPLRRNPSSHSPDFSDADLTIRRVTDPNNPVPYHMVARPATREEFMLDATNALVRFGAAQDSAEKIEVMHWTLDLRDDIVSVRYSGSISLDVWGKDAQEAGAVARGVQRKLAGTREVLRAQGFASLNPLALNAAASTVQQPGSGSAFSAWRQTLAYRFAFEAELGGEASAGGPIRRIHVDADDQLRESFSVPRTT